MRSLMLRAHSHLPHSLVITLLAVLCLCQGRATAELDPSHVQVKTEKIPAEDYGTPTRVYSLTDGDVHGEFLLAHSAYTSTPDIRFTVWRGNGPRSFDPDRSIPIERRIQFFHPLFQRLLKTEPASKTYTLFVYGYTELYDRMLDLAARDRGWNRRHGSPRAKTIGYSYLQHLLERGDAFREVVSMMKDFHYDVSIDHALEEQLVVQVKTLSPEQRSRISVPVKETDWLPARIAVVFRLAKEQR